ncbi:hypothetical protein [Janthinobacterium sp. 17J80-10]|uniref:hypothetical protein n=1 Tax=Janthinobacterium sp. 17J80-10 TaxID=2497863 RepID=UPI0019D6DE3C|nr:hypothetical protein [Janthinobacterium sp. 17J80-10]
MANSGDSGGTLLPEGSAASGAAGTTSAYPAYRIFLHHDGQAYVAEVPEFPACRGSGTSPASALAAAQGAIAAWLDRSVAPPPLMSASDLAQTIRDLLNIPAVAPKHGPRMSPVKQLLVKKFGKMSNREMATRIGLSGRDAPTMLSAAASGKGTRKARCAIALALNELPSCLWPNRQPAICQDDDSLYVSLHANADDWTPSKN